MAETCITYCDKDVAFFSSDERKWITKIRKLKEEYPEMVSIDREPEKNNGCICAKIPQEWVRVMPKKKVVMTEEQRAASAERMRALWNLKNNRANEAQISSEM